MLVFKRRAPLLVLGIVLGLGISGLVWFSIRTKVNGSSTTPLDIGAVLTSGMHLWPTQLQTSSISQSAAKTIAIRDFLQSDGYPPGIGVEQKVNVRLTAAVYSGPFTGSYGDEQSPGELVQNRYVWVAVLTNIPVWLGCGDWTASVCRTVTAGGQNPYPPKMTTIIDAQTGNILNGTLSGVGDPGPSWKPIIATAKAINEANATHVTPTPVPQAPQK